MSFLDKTELQDFSNLLWERIKLRFGSPLVAWDSGEMLDDTRIYVYMGSEPGWEEGDWYYYDGSSWVSGGAYNALAVATDTTLTAEGEAADAKAVGERLAATDGRLQFLTYDTLFREQVLPSGGDYWAVERGAVVASSGNNAVNNLDKYCRTINPTDAGRIRVDGPRLLTLGLAAYEWHCWSYSGTTWSTHSHSNTGEAWVSGLQPILVPFVAGDVSICVSFRRVDGQNMDTTTDYTAIRQALQVRRITDATLAKAGMPADAGAVGAALASKAPVDFTGKDILRGSGAFVSATDHGLTITWSWPEAAISGTRQSTQAIFAVYDNKTALPPGVQPGDRFLLRFNGSPQSVNLQWYLFFWNSSGNTWRFEAQTWSGTEYNLHKYLNWPVTVPEGAVGMTLQLRVPSGSGSFSGSVSYLELIKMPKRDMHTPLLISFIDDDTSGYEYVRKYREACRHNGVYGNYAVLTRFLEDDYTGSGWTGPQMRERLLGYEDEGFGMLLHAYRQSSSDPWSTIADSEANVAQCRGVLLQGLRDLRKYGFANYNHWVTPYGLRGSQIQRLAREAGVECLISTNNERHNSMQDYQRYFIKRVALNSDDTRPSGIANALQDVKDAIDATVAEGAGWLIVTTHFNEWGDLSWDSTLDANGFETGYARFNEMVQYALAAGLTPMTFQRAWSYYAPILDANNDTVNAVIAEEHLEAMSE